MGRPRGPVPKASADRRRSTSDGKVEVAPAGGGDVVAPRLRADLHPLAVRWYESLSESGQSRFYEPSDWAAAQIVAEAIDQYGRRTHGHVAAVDPGGVSGVAGHGGGSAPYAVGAGAGGDPGVGWGEGAYATVAGCGWVGGGLRHRASIRHSGSSRWSGSRSIVWCRMVHGRVSCCG